MVAKATWNTFRAGYEWDVLDREAGHIGITVDLHRNGLGATARLQDNPRAGFARFDYTHRLTIPTIGVAGEKSLTRWLSVSGDIVLLRLDRRRSGKFRDVDVFATARMTQWLGARVGYQTRLLDYAITSESNAVPAGSVVHEETGRLRSQAPYVGLAVRF